MTTGAQTAALPVNEGASVEHVGSPAMSTWYLAKSAAVIVSQTAPETTVTVKPAAVACVSSVLGLPETVSPLINASFGAAAAGDAPRTPPTSERLAVASMAAMSERLNRNKLAFIGNPLLSVNASSSTAWTRVDGSYEALRIDKQAVSSDLGITTHPPAAAEKPLCRSSSADVQKWN
jgi:hypothetical protein